MTPKSFLQPHLARKINLWPLRGVHHITMTMWSHFKFFSDFFPINPAQAKVCLGLYAKFNRVSGSLKLPDCFYLTHNIAQGHQRSCKNLQSWDYALSLHKCATAHKYGRWYGTAWLIQKSMQQPLNIGFQYNTADQLTWVHNNPPTWYHDTAQPWHRPRISLHFDLSRFR